MRNHLSSAGLLLALVMSLAPAALAGQQEDIQTVAQQVITVSRGSTAIITRPDSITRVLVSDPAIADPVAIPPNQVLINALQVGSTSLVMWDRFNRPRLYTIEVTADIASIQRQIDELFPDAGVTVASTGTSIVLSGEVRDPGVVRKVTELANTLGIPVVSNIQAPPPEQILLHVEFAEVSRSVLKELGGDLIRLINPETVDHAFDQGDFHSIETLSEGFVTLVLEGGGSRLDAVIRLLKNTGEFKSLAQPNLVTREGQTATFLAGGEFPFPVSQGGGAANAITITWKEFGVRLSFTPTITNSGNVRLQVEPEVSSLDFANGITFAGFNFPSLLTRRVSTDVELRPGQKLAIGGLLDHSMIEEIDKIPVLGDIPILGFFFKSKGKRQDRTELLVLVTPYVLDPNDLPAPPVPTGEVPTWDWDGYIGNWIRERGDTSGLPPRPGGR